MGPDDLAQVLRHLTPNSDPNLLVGTDTGDDAAVWLVEDGRALVSTADFFTPIVDDPRTWGRISATNAASDVYAMGGSPLFALNLVAWPRDSLSLDLLGEVMAGGSEAAASGGWIVAGGHTVDGPEPMYGQAVTGEVDPNRMLTNAAAREGDVLILTKPIGTGLLATAVKASEPEQVGPGGSLEPSYSAAVTEMTRLNDVAARVAIDSMASAATDITGFGLLGHLHKLALASALEAEIEIAQVPLLPQTEELLDAGFIPGGTVRNVESVTPHVDGGTDDQLLILADAQTSGGLLFGCEEGRVDKALQELADTGHTAAAIGLLRAGQPGHISLR